MLWLVSTRAMAQIQETPSPGSAAYQIISDQGQAEAVLAEVRAALASRWGFQLERPLDLKLVDASDMDSRFAGSPYKGAEIGLYVPGPHHTIYVMRGWSRDLCSGITAHEYTHAWQNENCPRQEAAVREGFAMWIEHKYLDSIGAYTEARKVVDDYEDPVYGVGIKTMLAWEDKVGEKGMVDLVRRVSSINDGPK